MELKISIVIPCYNEKSYIERCLDSFMEQSVEAGSYELIVVDGGSTDGTRKILRAYCENYPNVRMVENPERITPVALNRGIKASRAPFVAIFGAHSYAAPDFIEQNLATMERVEAACVGGTIETIGADPVAGAISFAMSSPFGVGNALFRFTKKEQYVDTVAFGLYRREIFDEVGLFDEELVRNQDAELNYRIIKSGNRIYLNPAIRSFYYSRSSLKRLWSQYHQYGYWKTRVIRKHRKPQSLRQLIPAIFLLSLLFTLITTLITPYSFILFSGIVSLYTLVDLAVTSRICRRKGFSHFIPLALSFPILHLSYGSGFIRGVISLLFRTK